MNKADRTDKGYWLTEADFKSIPADEIASSHVVKKPVVSVLMLAWNHAEFIDEAIESVVYQDIEFPFELIIGEDCSSDDTLARCRAWQQKYPAIIRILSTKNNVGMHHNFARMWHAARGTFVALCEGDDYWVDLQKLAKQIKWFDNQPDGKLVGTLTDLIELNGQGKWVINGRSSPFEMKKTYNFQELLQSYSFHFSSVMLRKESVRFPRWFWEVYCVDRPLYLLAAENGTAGLLPIVTSHYRQHSGGVWSPRSPVSKGEASTGLFRHLEQHFGKAYEEVCRQTLSAILWFYMSEAIAAEDWPAARRLFRQSLREDFMGTLGNRSRVVFVVLFRIYFPRIYNGMKRKTTGEAGA